MAFLVRRQGISVLCVDTNKTNLQELRLILEPEGFVFLAAHGGFECLSQLHRLKPTALLIEAAMPQLDGLQTCKRIRTAFKDIAAPIILIAEKEAAITIEAVRAAGGNDLVKRPLRAEKLTTVIDGWSTKAKATAGG